MLLPENTNYEPLVFTGDELDKIRIIGKAVAFKSDIR
jgi:repressor LexA